jgi:hypothetical protein
MKQMNHTITVNTTEHAARRRVISLARNNQKTKAIIIPASLKSRIVSVSGGGKRKLEETEWQPEADEEEIEVQEHVEGFADEGSGEYFEDEVEEQGLDETEVGDGDGVDGEVDGAEGDYFAEEFNANEDELEEEVEEVGPTHR